MEAAVLDLCPHGAARVLTLRFDIRCVAMVTNAEGCCYIACSSAARHAPESPQ